MGRGDKGDEVETNELDETVLTAQAGPEAEIQLTDLPRSGTGSKPATDATQTTQASTLESPQTTAKDALPTTAPRPQAPPEEPPVAGHRRGPGIWLPLMFFVALLTAGAVVGGLVVPGQGPAPGSQPAAAGRPSLTQPVPEATTPSRPALPTAPPRPADRLNPWALRIAAAVTVPPVAIQAYGYAQLTLAEQDPSCHVGWTTLAAVGEVESAHGQQGGAVLQANGRSAPLIVGPVLDGKGGRALVKDTDAGAYDADSTFDRAMGPMALTPTVWRSFGIDADGDGILDPYDIDDASMALARLLCSGGEDLTTRVGWDAAISRHHAGSAYAKTVFTSADSYGQRTKDVA